MPKRPLKNADDLDFLAIYKSAFDEALQDALRELHFAECTTGETLAEVFLAAEKLARGRVDEYVQRRLSATEYEKYKMFHDFTFAVASWVTAPAERTDYWAERLGIYKATDGIASNSIALGRYMIAKHGWTRYRFENANYVTIADILEKDAAVQEQNKDTPDTLVRLSQVTPYTGTCAKTVRRRILQDCPPDIQGGNGKPDLWLWSKLRLALEPMAAKPLPITFPGDRIIP